MPETDESIDDETVVEQPEEESAQPAVEEEAEPEKEEGAEEPEGEEEPAPTRGERRQQRLANELKAEREARIRAEAERDAFRTRPSPSSNPDEDRRREEEKMALMDPQERRDYMRDKEVREMKQTVAMTQFQMRDAMDKTGFEAEIRGNPALEKMKGEVDKLYADALKNGNFVPRLSLLDYVIGKQAREKLKQPAGKTTVAAKKAAGERVESVKSKPMSGKSDTGGKAAQDEREARMARIQAAERARGIDWN